MILNEIAGAIQVSTESALSKKEIFLHTLRLEWRVRDEACEDVYWLIALVNIPFYRVYPMIKDEFKKVADKYRLDPAVLYWSYLLWSSQEHW
jgi:hypothetical protein